MILMNNYCAKDLLTFNNGIFRSTNLVEIPDNINKIIYKWNNESASYINLETTSNSIKHNALNLNEYIHITSPIRRIVDLLNLIIFQKNRKLINLSLNSFDFYNKWVNDIDFINIKMKTIKKIHNEFLLFETVNNNENILNKLYDGICFDKIELHNNELYKYTVYLNELKLTCDIVTSCKLDNYTEHKFQLFIYNNENTLKRKIRLQLS